VSRRAALLLAASPLLALGLLGVQQHRPLGVAQESNQAGDAPSAGEAEAIPSSRAQHRVAEERARKGGSGERSVRDHR
jgi:hypothetical protein